MFSYLSRSGVKTWLQILLFLSLAILLALKLPTTQRAFAQQPTGSIPTVTGTPRGPMVTVYTNFLQVRVYSGPSSYTYPPVGVLMSGEQVPALGRTANSEWILVRYIGIASKEAWVYAPYVSISTSSSALPVVEPPPLPTPATTPTIDPTLAAAFPVEGTSFRLPTFTPPPTIAIPTFVEESPFALGRFPIGMIIFGLIFLGFFGAIIALMRGR